MHTNIPHFSCKLVSHISYVNRSPTETKRRLYLQTCIVCHSFISKKACLNRQAELEEEVAANAAAISSLEVNVCSHTVNLQETSEELQILQGANESLEDSHKAITARLELQLAARWTR